jgi:hypothetical protein
MPKQPITSAQERPAEPVADAVTPGRNGRSIPPEAAKLMDELAARGRALRQQAEAEGAAREDKRKDPDWQRRWDELLARVRSELPPGITPEEIEAEITRASECG